MANRFGRTQRKMGKTVARKRRLTILPKADKLWLLAGTALVTGAVLWPAHPALAECVPTSPVSGLILACEDAGVPPVIEEDPQDFTATGDGWQVDVGVNETIGTISVDDPSDEALDIYGDGYDGQVDITFGSTVEQTAADGYEAIDLDDFGVVTLNNAGTVTNNSTSGGYSAIDASGFEEFIVNNTGHIGSDGGSGISASNGGFVSINNMSQETVLGVFAGADVSFLDEFEYLNSGGITIGYDGFSGGQGVDFREISGFDVPNVPDLSLPVDDDLFADSAQDDDLSALIVNFARVTKTDLLDGGMILGGEDGIYGEDIWTGDVLIANQGYWELEDPDGDEGPEVEALVFRDGGMIVGNEDDGVDINGAGESVFIYNNNTQDSVAARSLVENDGSLTALEDVDFADQEVEDFFDDFTSSGNAPDNFYAGIWGEDNGISVDGEDEGSDETKYVGIYNINGLIGGRDGNGITAYDIEGEDPSGGLGPNETSQAIGIWNGAGGMIWGGDEGIDLNNIDGSVFIDNAGLPGSSLAGFNSDQMAALFGPDAAMPDFTFDGGNIFGEDNGIEITDVDDGDVTIRNALGSVVGYYSDGIYAEEVSGTDSGNGLVGGHVAIWNGDMEGLNGGLIFGDSSAISIGEDCNWGNCEYGADRVSIYNGEGGVIAGYGHYPAAPTIYLKTSSNSGLLYDGDDTDEDLDAFGDDIAAGYIYNAGLISDYYLPTMFFGDHPAVGEQYVWGNEDDVLAADLDSFAAYVMSGGSKSQLDGSEHGLWQYSYSASGLAIWGEDGALEIDNYGTLVGNVWADGYNSTYSGPYISNTINNYGTWLVSGEDGFDTDIDYVGSEDTINNEGWIQTAFEDWSEEGINFYVDDFVNYGSTGVISMVDGMGEDWVDIEGNFHGPDADAYDAGSRSYVAMDVFLQDENVYYDENGRDPGDYFYVGEDISGTTGLIIRKVNDEAPGEGVIDGYIGVAYVDGDDNGECFDEFCAVGNSFYIASQSDGYFESNEGTGFIEDGLFAWGLVSNPDYIYGGEDIEYALVGMPGPGAVNAPKVATGALEIADEIFDVVYDHNYGQQFGGGGSGADLPVDAPVYDAPAASSGGTQTGLWAKITGSRTDREDTVTEGGNTFDSGYNQDIYSILGGADMKWDPNSPFRMGVFGGYVTSSMDFDLGTGEVDYEGGVVGTYLAYNDGAFYMDATVKGEFLSADYSFDSTEVDTDVVNIGVSANTGYRFTMGRSYFEPLASVRYVHSDLDDFTGGGGTVTYDDADSLKAGAGARIGTAFGGAGGTSTDISLLGRVWNEFSDDNEVTVSDGMGSSFTYSDDISGLYGEVAGTVTVTSSDGSLSGFLQASGQFGDDYTKYGAKAGVRKGF